jgi:hypothetical protein
MAHVKFHISGQGPGEHQRGGALQRAAKPVLSPPMTGFPGGPVGSVIRRCSDTLGRL